MCRTIKIDNIEWNYSLEEKRGKGYIIFYSPIYLINEHALSVHKKIRDEKDNKLIEEKLNAAIKAKHKLKLTDSFHTKFRIFFFIEFLKGEDLNKKCETVEKLKREFNDFKIEDNESDCFSSQYYQKEDSDNIVYEKIDSDGILVKYEKKSKDITENLFDSEKKVLKKYVFNLTDNEYRTSAKEKNKEITSIYEILKEVYLQEHQKKFTIKEFKELILNTSCSYCGITIEQIKTLGKKGKLHNKRSETRGYSLEIDRKYPNLEYTTENCCMSCYWCNNAKTDEFLPLEFKGIARGINCIWKQRGADIVKFNEIEFWKNVDDECK